MKGNQGCLVSQQHLHTMSQNFEKFKCFRRTLRSGRSAYGRAQSISRTESGSEGVNADEGTHSGTTEHASDEVLLMPYVHAIEYHCIYQVQYILILLLLAQYQY